MDINAKSSRQLGCSQSIDGCSSLNCIRRQDKDVVDEEVALHILKVSNGFYHQIQLGVASLNIPRKVGKTTRWGKVKLSKSIFHKTYKTYHMTWSSQQTAPRYDLSMQRNISKQAAAMHRFSLTQCAGRLVVCPTLSQEGNSETCGDFVIIFQQFHVNTWKPSKKYLLKIQLRSCQVA